LARDPSHRVGLERRRRWHAVIFASVGVECETTGQP
jgi:hypothetical protein